ncbi:MAG TPA: UDP-glucuronic acid decarboxylase family protein [Burkholderiales bacterium]
MPKRILVTGGAGFIGRHLCERLLRDGHKVLCLDNFCTGAKHNVAELLAHPNFRLVTHDVCLPFDFEVDEIYNLACPASPVHYQRDPLQTLKTSVYGAVHALELALHRDARVLQASTSEVYGDPVAHPQSESYWGNVNPIGPRSCYDEGKRCAETLFVDYRRQRGARIKIARIFNTYGPYMQEHDGRVVSNFIVQALAHRPITLYGDGTQTRSFCYVSDLVEALVRLMESPEDVTGPVNLGNPQECSMYDLARLVKRLTGSRSPIVFAPLPADDPRRRRPDITRAQALLGWSPTVSLEEGLPRTIAFFEARRRDADAAPPSMAAAL